MRSEFGQRLYEARKSIPGLTQAKIAKAVGMSQSNYADLESFGQGSAFTPAIAAFCGVSVEWLAYGKGDKFPTVVDEQHTERLRAAALSILAVLKEIPEAELGDAVLDAAKVLQKRRKP